MKITYLEMGLMKIQAETSSESRVISGIIEMNFKLMPDAVANCHGCVVTRVGKRIKKIMNWCLIPDGHLDGECHKTHKARRGCDCVKPGIDAGMKKWAKLPWDYQFKPAK